jgi:putative acetyltransferase
MIELKRTTSEDSDFQNLVILLDEYLKIIDGDEHVFYAELNKTGKIQHVVICYSEGVAVGCGAFRKFDEATIEIKRMYVMPEYRKNGFAGKILKELETWAVEINYSQFILETGKRQPDAIRLYKKAGYELIPNFGPYKNSENSVCFKKNKLIK